MPGHKGRKKRSRLFKLKAVNLPRNPLIDKNLQDFFRTYVDSDE